MPIQSQVLNLLVELQKEMDLPLSWFDVLVNLYIAPDCRLRMRELADEVARAERARDRYVAHTERLEKEQIMREQQLEAQKQAARDAGPRAIEEILERSGMSDPDEK